MNIFKRCALEYERVSVRRAHSNDVMIGNHWTEANETAEEHTYNDSNQFTIIALPATRRSTKLY